MIAYRFRPPTLSAALLLLFALVASLLLSAPGHARAEACAGRDLRPLMEEAVPGTLARLEGLTAENGTARLWRITAPDGGVSHLYGTMHVSDPGIVALGPEAEAAFESAETVVIETTDVLDPEKSAASMFAHPDLLFFTDGRDLTDVLDDAQEAALRVALETRGMSLEAVRTLKPWVLATQISVPACMMEAGPILDVRLAEDAQRSGREVRGLETAVEQMEAMAGLPLSLHVASLVDAAAMGDAIDDVFATMGMLYAEGRIGAIWPMMAVAAETLGGVESTAGADDLAAFEEALVTRRNHTMAERSEDMLREGGVFLAVGALHLPGPEGLVALLRERGFEVEAVAP